MNQNQERQIIITKVTFLEIQEVEGGKVLIFSREYSNGAKDLKAQTPVIKDEDFEKYVNLHIESFQKTIKESEEFLKKVEEEVYQNRVHLNSQIEFLTNILKPVE